VTHHLSSQELVDALSGQFVSTRHQRHFETCDRCRSQVADLRGVMARVGAGVDVPEPSPLFWDHFSQRVRAATPEIPPVRQAWWSSGWRPIVGVAAVLVALLMAVAVRHNPLPAGSVVATDALPIPAAPATEDESLNVIAQLTSGMSFEDLQLAAQPTPDATDALMGQLSAAEREQLVRLINAEKGSSE
jgi:hypothetical protein